MSGARSHDLPGWMTFDDVRFVREPACMKQLIAQGLLSSVENSSDAGASVELTSIYPKVLGPRLSVSRLNKWYGPVHALVNVTLEFEPRRVHAIVGENGAGKSTLGRVLAGVIRPDSGCLLVNGEEVSFGSPSAAHKRGITRVSQELSLVPKRNVIENVLIGRIPTRFKGIVSRSAMIESFNELQKLCRVDVDPWALVGGLSLADQARVEIMRALAGNAQALILDEPTSAMSRDDTR